MCCTLLDCFSMVSDFFIISSTKKDRCCLTKEQEITIPKLKTRVPIRCLFWCYDIKLQYLAVQPGKNAVSSEFLLAFYINHPAVESTIIIHKVLFFENQSTNKQDLSHIKHQCITLCYTLSKLLGGTACCHFFVLAELVVLI